MLTNFKIKKLFGLYDYDLTFSKSEDDRIRFITATNGYGKSTILRLIDAVFNRHLEVFFNVPFQEILLTVDKAILQISQIKEHVIAPGQEAEAVDKEDDVAVAFGIGMTKPIKMVRLTLDDIQKGSDELGNVLQQIEMFFSSETCKFIDDRRLLRENTDASELVRLSDLVREKLQRPDEDTEKQIASLIDIVDRSCFANKHMEIDPAFGFRFVSNNEDKTKLAMSGLSSGEQHIMLMSLYMLFEAPSKAIVLVDEPEMSFHLSWQGDYLKSLRQIVALKNVQCIIATHSPIIFDSEYSLAIDLYEQMHPEE